MTDYERDPEPPVRETERTTIIHDTGDRGGGSGVALGLLVAVVIVLILFFAFGRGFIRGGHDGGTNVNVAVPKVTVPDVNVKVPDINVKVPDVKVTIPKIDVKTEDSNGNKSGGK